MLYAYVFIITLLTLTALWLLYHFSMKTEHLDQTIQTLKNNNHQLQQKISEQTRAQTNAQNSHSDQSSYTDHLTSLPNRLFFNVILNKAINHARRQQQMLALLDINIDDFDKLHSLYGDTAANKILRELGIRFSSVLRTEDILAKLEGDEFIILLNDIDKPKFASAVADKLLKACALPFTIEANQCKVSVSIGICVFPADGGSLENLMQNVLAALDSAKRVGGNNYQFYTKEMGDEAHEYLKQKDALSKAIENNELSLYYQPKYHLKRGHIVGVEALLRWEHPKFVSINPSIFIPLAEESGMIMTLGEWALNEACKMNKHWQEEGYEHICVAVNLSTKQFYHPGMVSVIEKALKASGLNPRYLEIEITENIVMNNVEVATDILEKIKALGVQISIDHFGTGYTSISHLKKFPINAVKIDSSFIHGVPQIPNDLAITNALIALIHNLGFDIVAEGVETEEQVEYLSAQNCDIIQGFFLSQPLPAEKVELQFKRLMESAPI